MASDAAAARAGSGLAARLGLAGLAREGRWRVGLVAALLALHVGWMGVHLTLVAAGAINPWKLGGYGMYTVPNSFPRTHVYVFDSTAGRWLEVARNRANSHGFDTANHLHVFRCRAPTLESIRRFLDENPHLRGLSMTLALSERTFHRDPIRVERKVYSKVDIRWSSPTSFVYQSNTCGELAQGRADYTPR